ncbi:hypothetical protein ASPCAL04241 [Aspergillus calidoustus]|uniref:Uncharacterized protein n=1 Tax=Aspergillus calidoustus TaxID=454130 RepID=A0A0U5FUH9_ASPCI|nr:hypothetical protein ASPCAL04241 [Aspergillus calidoustus]
MARRYDIDELLWLRSSPLVTRPANLPPVEDWMGPLPDPTTQRKSSNNAEPSGRRPSLFETRHISRNSASEDIILGPPKTAFASASRIPGKGSIDATERPLRQGESDDPKNSNFNLRDKFFKERDSGDRDFAGRDGKMGTFNNRRGEKEDWNNGRPRRTLGPDEQERKPRRNGEFDRWETRDPRDPNSDRAAKDKDGRFFTRREVPPGRARHEGSWFRDDSTQEAPDTEEEKASLRSRDWRRDRQGADRDWNRGGKLEQEPEWLDSTDRDESRRVHTQEDFERWKEKMKAGSSQPPPEEKKESHIEQIPEPVQNSESRPTDGEIFSPSGAALQHSTMERFFGLLGDAKHAQDMGVPLPAEPAIKKEAAAFLGKPGKSSRFAGLFSPPLGSPGKEPESPISSKSPAPPPMPINPSSTDADQEGFQRILQMLGGGKSHNATPHNDPAQINIQANRQPSMVPAEQTRSPVASPLREQGQRPELMQMPFQDTPSRGPEPGLKENMYSQEPQPRDREHLLRLMQQVRVSPGSGQGQGPQHQPQSAGPTPGLMNIPDAMPHPPGIGHPGPAMKGPNFLDDPAIATMQRSDVEQLRRRNGPPLGYFDEVPFPQAAQVPVTPGGGRGPQGQAPPGMGIQRPPGFEHMPPPGWGGHLPPPQQAGPPGPLAPPGIPTPNRGVNPNYIPNVMPLHGNLPINDRQPFPRGPPPGMIPPPGFMNGPPPSGFPPMPHGGENLMGPFDGNPGLQGPPPSSRHLLDMFGQVGGGDARGGGMVGPRQFR